MTGREGVQHNFSTVGCGGALPSAQNESRQAVTPTAWGNSGEDRIRTCGTG